MTPFQKEYPRINMAISKGELLLPLHPVWFMGTCLTVSALHSSGTVLDVPAT